VIATRVLIIPNLKVSLPEGFSTIACAAAIPIKMLLLKLEAVLE